MKNHTSNMSRKYSFLDNIFIQLDNFLQAIGEAYVSVRKYPADGVKDDQLSIKEKKHNSGLMRVNHSGEVCAQALYNAQALMASNYKVAASLTHAATEEVDHLVWCSQRLKELNSYTSYLNCFWYFNSFAMGVFVGFFGDKWNLGFVEETEIQVGKHLDGHLKQLQNDSRSYVIVEQMKIDESKHAECARNNGAESLPEIVKMMMKFHAKVMTTLSFWI